MGRVRSFFAKLFRRKSAPNNPRAAPNKKSGGLMRRIVRKIRGDYAMENSELLFSAISRIANALSAMPINLYKGADIAETEDLNDLIHFAPNPNMTSCNWIKTMEACRCTNGNCYALKGFDGEIGPVTRLDIMDPSRVTPIYDSDSGELWYRIYPESGPEILMHNFYVVHVPFISANGFNGVNPVSVLADTLGYSENIQSFSREQLEKGLNAAIVLEAPANLGEEQRKDVVDDFMNTYKETAGNILLLESGVTAKSLNLSPVDTKLFEVEKITRSKVAMVYNIPPHLLGDYSDTSFSSQEQQMLEFLMLTMLPIVTAYEQEFDRKLLTKAQRKAGYHFKFDTDAILRVDANTQADVDQKNVRSGVTTLDEVRKRKHLPAYKGGIGSKPLVSQDLAPLDYTVNTKPDVLSAALNKGSDEKAATGDDKPVANE